MHEFNMLKDIIPICFICECVWLVALYMICLSDIYKCLCQQIVTEATAEQVPVKKKWSHYIEKFIILYTCSSIYWMLPYVFVKCNVNASTERVTEVSGIGFVVIHKNVTVYCSEEIAAPKTKKRTIKWLNKWSIDVWLFQIPQNKLKCLHVRAYV